MPLILPAFGFLAPFLRPCRKTKGRPGNGKTYVGWVYIQNRPNIINRILGSANRFYLRFLVARTDCPLFCFPEGQREIKRKILASAVNSRNLFARGDHEEIFTFRENFCLAFTADPFYRTVEIGRFFSIPFLRRFRVPFVWLVGAGGGFVSSWGLFGGRFGRVPR